MCTVRSGDRDPRELKELEDELRDPSNFLEYLLPRPVRQTLLWGSALSCLIATILTIIRITSSQAQVNMNKHVYI